MYYEGLVMKIKSEYSVVLTPKNEYFMIGNKKGLSIGQKIYFVEEDIIKKQESTLSSVQKFAIVACLLLSILISLQWLQVNTYAVISIDINPSVELKVDRNQRVIGYNAYNSEGSALLDDSMIGQDLDVVLDSIFIIAESALYLNDDHRNVLVGVAGSNRYSEDTMLEIESLVREKTKQYQLDTLLVSGNQEIIKESKYNGKSVGKVVLSELLSSEGEQAIEKLSVKEIMKNNKYNKLLEKNTIRLEEKQNKTDEKEEREQIKTIDKKDEVEQGDNNKEKTEINKKNKNEVVKTNKENKNVNNIKVKKIKK